jgi:exosortase A-associated hydrolase 2
MGGVREEMFFFEGGRTQRLLGFLHAPAEPKAALVYCHPFAEERNQSQGVVVRTSRRLAKEGVAVLRFDLSGCGDSEGLLQDAHADHWLDDIDAAFHALKTRVKAPKIGVWGLRAGANLAARYATDRTDLDFGVFWQPFPDFKLAMTQFLRQKVGTQMAAKVAGSAEAAVPPVSVKSLVQELEAGQIVEVMGYPLKHGLYASLLGSDKPFASVRFGFPGCLVSFGEDEGPSEGMRRIHESLVQNNPGFDLIHAREMPFWDRYWRWEGPAAEVAMARWVQAAL